MALAGTFEHGIGQISLGLVKAQNLLLDGVLRDEVIDGDVLALTKAIGTIGGLLLDSRVPPRVEMDDIVGPCQVQAQSACFQADEEHRAVTMLELLHQLIALTYGHRTVEIEIRLLLFVQALAH